MIQFFMAMEPPTTTAQQHRIIASKGGKPRFYDTPELADARAKLKAHLAVFRPPCPAVGPLRLLVKWCFLAKNQPDGTWKTTKPDTDNLQKMLKDVMTGLGFWGDDAQVASEIAEKVWSARPGIFIRIEELD